MSSNGTNRTVHAPPRVEVRARFDREALGTADPEAHVVARVRAAKAAPGAPTPPLSLAIVIDASGSMAGAKLENAKQAAILLARRLRLCDQLAVVSFADDVVVHSPPRAMTAEQQALVEAEIRALHTRGNTDLAAGWMSGAFLLQPIAAPGRRTHVILLSDGMANRGLCEPPALGERSRALRLAGVTTTCVGVGEDYSTTQLGPIAEHGGGRFHHADEAREIERLLLGELAELGAVAVRNARITARAAPGLVVEPVSELVAAQAGEPAAHLLGDLVDGAERLVVLRVRPQDAEARPTPWQVTVTVEGEDAGTGAPLAPVAEVCVLPQGATQHVAPRPEDAEAVANAWGARVRRRAADFNERGEYRRVRQMVQDEAQAMRVYACGSGAAAAIVDEAAVEAERLEGSVAPQVAKGLFVRGWKGSRGERDLRGTE